MTTPSLATVRLSLYAFGPILALFLLLFVLRLADDSRTGNAQTDPSPVISF